MTARTARRVGLLEACDDAQLFGLRLHPVQRQLLAGLERTPNAVWACGRRGGKTMLASVVCLYDALLRPDLDALVRPGELRYSVAVATNIEQARVLVRSARLIVEASPLLGPLLVSSTADELLFDLGDGVKTGVRAFPCSSRGIRGYPISTAVLDECAHFVTTEDGNAAAEQLWGAMRPATAQFGAAGRALVVSSPMGDTGFFATHFAKAQRGELAGWEAAQHSTGEMNPAIAAEYLAELEAESPDTFGSEYLALFESGGAAFIDMGRFEPGDVDVAQPGDAVDWIAGLDPALTSDAFGVALLGRDGSGRVVVGPCDAIMPERKRGWTFERKRAATDRVLGRVGELCRAYGARVFTDQHESQAIVSRLRELGVTATVIGMTRETKLAAFRELRDRLYGGSLVLPRHQALLEELSRVQIKIGEGGAKIVLPRSSRGHCDMAQALALGCYELRHDRRLRFTVPTGRVPSTTPAAALGVDPKPTTVIGLRQAAGRGGLSGVPAWQREFTRRVRQRPAPQQPEEDT